MWLQLWGGAGNVVVVGGGARKLPVALLGAPKAVWTKPEFGPHIFFV